jgi:hypothetical protein
MISTLRSGIASRRRSLLGRAAGGAGRKRSKMRIPRRRRLAQRLQPAGGPGRRKSWCGALGGLPPEWPRYPSSTGRLRSCPRGRYRRAPARPRPSAARQPQPAPRPPSRSGAPSTPPARPTPHPRRIAADFEQREPHLGSVPRLFEHHHVDRADGLEHARFGNQDPAARGGRHRGGQGQRRGDGQGAGARDRCIRASAGRPVRGCHPAKASTAGMKRRQTRPTPCSMRVTGRGGLHRAHDPCQGAVRAGPGRPYLQDATRVGDHGIRRVAWRAARLHR